MGWAGSVSATGSGVDTPRVGAPCVPHLACRRHAQSSCLRRKQRACVWFLSVPAHAWFLSVRRYTRGSSLCGRRGAVPLCASASAPGRARPSSRAPPPGGSPPRTRRRYTLLTPLSNSHNFRCKSFQGSYAGMTTQVLTPLHNEGTTREVAQGVQAALDSVEQHLSMAPRM